MTSPASFEYSPIFERITDGFIAFDTEYRYIYFNSRVAEMMHMDLPQLMGKCIFDVFPDLAGGVLYTTMHRAMETQQHASSTGFYPPMGIWVEYYIYPSPDGLTVLVRDVTEIKKAEERIARERHLSESIVSSLPGIFYLYDDTGRFIHWNKNFETVTGYSGAEIAEMHPLDFFDGEQREVIQSKIAEVFAKKQATVEAVFTTKDKKQIPFFYTGREISYGGKRCLVGVGIDITDRVHAEQSVVEWEKRFRHTLDHMLEGVQIFNADWRCIYANQTIASQSPYTVAETVGKTLMETFPGIEETELFRIFRDCLDHGISRHLEYQFTFPDGSAKWFELSIQPNTEGLFVLSIDIDERKKAEEAMRKSEEKYRYLFNNNPALIVIWDPELMTVMEINDKVTELYGYTREEYMQMSVLEYRPVEDHAKIREFAHQMLSGDTEIYKGMWRHLKKNGDLMYMDITSHRIEYNGRVAVLSLAKDMTDQYKAEEQLRKTYEDIRRLNNHLQTVREEERLLISREIHDELGQQLTGLKMDISWLAKRIKADDEAVPEKIRDIVSLIDDTVRTVRRISSDLRPGILDDLGLLAALEWQSSEFARRTGVAMRFVTMITELDLGKSESIGIFRVYQEALTNITRHASATAVTTTLEQEGNDLVLTIEDNGIGYDIQEKQKGHTLGLVGMNERAIMLGGGIYMESEAGKGTKVILRVPIHPSTSES